MKIIIVREDNDAELKYDINENETTIQDLKKLIEANNPELLFKEQRFEYNGKRLKNRHLVAYYFKKDNTKIILKRQAASNSSSESSSSSAGSGGDEETN